MTFCQLLAAKNDMTTRRDPQGVLLYATDDFPSTEIAMASFVSRFLKARGVSVRSSHGEAADAPEEDANRFREDVR